MKTIFALGDHAPADIAVNKYIASLTGKPNPKLCFIGTATGDSATYLEAIEAGFAPFGCTTKALGLFNLPTANLRGYVLDSDIIYVGGGNTRSMLAVWREWGVDVILREAWEAGIVLCGPSAGSICWFEQGTTDSIPGSMTRVNGLGFLPYSHSPHYNGEPLRRPAFQRMIGDGTLKSGYAADKLVGLLFHDTELVDVVSARPDATAYWVEQVDGSVVETAVEPTIYL